MGVVYAIVVGIQTISKKNLNVNLPFNPATVLLDIYPREMKIHVTQITVPQRSYLYL